MAIQQRDPRGGGGNRDARTNRRIKAREVRLVGVEGEQLGVLPVEQALAKAQELGLDLVEVSPMAKPPVCKIMGEFLEESNKARITVMFRGREMSHRELGQKVLTRVIEDLRDVAVIESAPRMEGRQMFMILAPNPKVLQSQRDRARAQAAQAAQAASAQAAAPAAPGAEPAPASTSASAEAPAAQPPAVAAAPQPQNPAGPR